MHSPFKFLDSYTREDKEVFFGRKTEIEELYTRIYQSNLLLVYGPSGTGKTSLIQCGLGNKFQDSDWLPLYIRRASNINQSIKTNISAVSVTKIQSDTTLSKQINSLFLDHFKPIYLIFDQFEELFIFGSEEEKRQFIHEIAELVQSNLQCKLLFVIREEYLAHLTEFEYILPQLFENRLRVEKMNRTKAEEVITGPCQVAGIEVEEGFAKNLLEKLSPEKTDIELTYLQVFLDKLYKLNPKQFTNNILEQVGRVGDVLASFLEEQVSHIPDSESALNVLKAFVSVEGTKKQMSYSEIREFILSIGKNIPIEKIETLVHQFVDLRILRDKDERGKYELRHDSLAAKIYEKITVVEKELMEVRQMILNAFREYEKREVLLREDDLKYLSLYEGKLFIDERLIKFIDGSKKVVLKNKRKRRRIEVLTVISLFVVMAAFTWWAMRERSKAIHSNKILKASKLTFIAQSFLDKNHFLSFRLAEAAYKISPNNQSEKIIRSAFGKGPLFNKIDGEVVATSQKLNRIITCVDKKELIFWDFNGNKICNLKDVFCVPENILTFPDEKMFIVHSADLSQIVVYNYLGEKLFSFPSTSSKLNIINPVISKKGNYFSFSDTSGCCFLWDNNFHLLDNSKTSFKNTHLDFSPDEKYACYITTPGSGKRNIIFYDILSKSKIYKKIDCFQLRILPDNFILFNHSLTHKWTQQSINSKFEKIYSGIFLDYSYPQSILLFVEKVNTLVIYSLEGKIIKFLYIEINEINKGKFANWGNSLVVRSVTNEFIIWYFGSNIINKLFSNEGSNYDFSLTNNLLLYNDNDGVEILNLTRIIPYRLFGLFGESFFNTKYFFNVKKIWEVPEKGIIIISSVNNACIFYVNDFMDKDLAIRLGTHLSYSNSIADLLTHINNGPIRQLTPEERKEYGIDD